HTIFSRDLSSDVCSSDLQDRAATRDARIVCRRDGAQVRGVVAHAAQFDDAKNPSFPAHTFLSKEAVTSCLECCRKPAQRNQWRRDDEPYECKHDVEAALEHGIDEDARLRLVGIQLLFYGGRYAGKYQPNGEITQHVRWRQEADAPLIADDGELLMQTAQPVARHEGSARAH